MPLVPFIPTGHLVTSYLPPRYEPYRKRQGQTWLDALHTWRDKTRSKLTWNEEFRREGDNRAKHIMTPILTCMVYEMPSEDAQSRLRCAANDLTEALEGAKSAVRSRLGKKALLGFYGKVEDSGKVKSHCRYRVVNISYTYILDNLAITECQGEGSTKNDARQDAARQLLQSGAYCMLFRNNGKR